MVFKVRKRNVDPIPPLREEVDHRRAEQVEVVLGNHLLQFRRRPIEMQNEFNFRGANIFQDVAQLADLEEPEAVRASKILITRGRRGSPSPHASGRNRSRSAHRME